MSIPADESVAKASPATVIDLDSEPLPISRFSDAFSMDHRFQSVMFLDFMGSEMVVVERPGLAVMQSLPEGFYKHSYGT